MGHKERKCTRGDREFCRRSRARRRFLINRWGERKASSRACSRHESLADKGISSVDAQKISVFPIRELLPPATLKVLNEMFLTATNEDIERRRAEQVDRFPQHLRGGTLTPEWEKFGRRYTSEIVVFQRETKATGLRNR